MRLPKSATALPKSERAPDITRILAAKDKFLCHECGNVLPRDQGSLMAYSPWYKHPAKLPSLFVTSRRASVCNACMAGMYSLEQARAGLAPTGSMVYRIVHPLRPWSRGGGKNRLTPKPRTATAAPRRTRGAKYE